MGSRIKAENFYKFKNPSRHLKRFLAVLMMAFLVVPLSGCSFSFLDSQNLISPPKANEDQQQIQNLLHENDTDTSLVYPKSGDYRSAIIMYNFTGGESEDAVAFKLIDSGGVEVHFLTKINDTWKNISTIKNSSSLVDRVLFGDIDGDGVEDVIIGWGDTQALMSAIACAYVYEDGRMIEYQIDASYGSLTLTDYDSDGKMEILLLQKTVTAQDESSEDIPAQASLYQFSGSSIDFVSSTEAYNNISRYSSVQFCKLTDEISAVVVDGEYSDRSSATQIFYFDGSRLSSYPQNPNENPTSNIFYRPAGASFTSKDITGNGITEIPSATLLPALPEDASLDSTSYFIEWKTLNSDYEFETAITTLSNITEGYIFELPESLSGKINAISDSTQRAVTYNLVVTDEETEEQYISSALFTIKVFSDYGWEQRGELLGYEKLTEDSGYVYGILVQAKDGEYSSQIKKIKESFMISTS